MATGDDAVAAGMDIIDPATGIVKDGAEEINKTRDYIAQKTSDVTPVAKGGTGAATASGARSNLGAVENESAPANSIKLFWNGMLGRLRMTVDSTNIGNIATTADLDGKRNTTDGNFGSTPIYTPHGRANPVTSSYVSAWLNVDGRIGASASSARYKKDIEDYDGNVLELQPRVFRFKDDELGTIRLGLIAEEVNEIEPLLVRHEDGQPEGVHYEFLAVALLKEVQRLARRVAALEAGQS